MAKKQCYSLWNPSQKSFIKTICWLSAIVSLLSWWDFQAAHGLLSVGILRLPGSDQCQFTIKPDKTWDQTNSPVWKKMSCSQWKSFKKVIEWGLWHAAEILTRGERYTEVPKACTLTTKIFLWLYHIDSWVSPGLCPNLSEHWKKTHCCSGLVDHQGSSNNHPNSNIIGYSVTIFHETFLFYQTQTTGSRDSFFSTVLQPIFMSKFKIWQGSRRWREITVNGKTKFACCQKTIKTIS